MQARRARRVRWTAGALGKGQLEGTREALDHRNDPRLGFGEEGQKAEETRSGVDFETHFADLVEGLVEFECEAEVVSG